MRCVARPVQPAAVLSQRFAIRPALRAVSVTRDMFSAEMGKYCTNIFFPHLHVINVTSFKISALILLVGHHMVFNMYAKDAIEKVSQVKTREQPQQDNDVAQVRCLNKCAQEA